MTVIGLCELDLHLEGIQSLKSKRGIIKRIKARVRSKFNVSVAEVDYLDTWQRSTLAVAVVANDQRFANQVLSQVVNLVAACGDAMLIQERMTFY